MLKGKITKCGELEIERPGGAKSKKTWCECEEVPCGDWCPQFGEPRQVSQHGEGHTPDAYSPWYLLICQGRTLVFESLADERKKGGG